MRTSEGFSAPALFEFTVLDGPPFVFRLEGNALLKQARSILATCPQRRVMGVIVKDRPVQPDMELPPRAKLDFVLRERHRALRCGQLLPDHRWCPRHSVLNAEVE